MNCPACDRRSAVLSRKEGGRYRGYELRDGGRLYACSYEDCHLEVYLVAGNGKVHVGRAAIFAPAVLRLIEAIKDADKGFRQLAEHDLQGLLDMEDP